MRRPWPALGRRATTKKNLVCILYKTALHNRWALVPQWTSVTVLLVRFLFRLFW